MKLRDLLQEPRAVACYFGLGGSGGFERAPQLSLGQLTGQGREPLRMFEWHLVDGRYAGVGQLQFSVLHFLDERTLLKVLELPPRPAREHRRPAAHPPERRAKIGNDVTG